VVDATGYGRRIERQVFDGLALGGKALLIHTGWSRHWRTDQYFEGHPFLTSEAAEFIAAGRPAIVGIDSYNIDDTADMSRPAHSVLLGKDIPIVEHMTALHRLPAAGFTFYAVPVKVRGFGTFPVRAFARVGED
jgi:kynurenine formamidase